jgi:hypothetical protein
LSGHRSAVSAAVSSLQQSSPGSAAFALAVQPVRPCRICRFGIRPSKTDAYIDLQQIALLLLLLVGNGWQQGKSGGLPSGKTALQGVENQWITIGWMYWSR